MAIITFISLIINVILILITIVNYKPDDWITVYNIHYILSSGDFYPIRESNENMYIEFSRSRNNYRTRSSDSNYKVRPSYTKLVEKLNEYNGKL